MGLWATIWTARFATAIYALAVVLCFRARRNTRFVRAARNAWTVALCALIFHVLCAFAFIHDWSHQHALRHTAAQTEEFTGFRSGAGLYVNYVFVALWLADVVLWWRDSHKYHGRISWVACFHALRAFMFVNASIIFASGVGRWWGIACFTLIAIGVMTRNGGSVAKPPVDHPL